MAEVLTGANTEKLRRWRHETLSTYGIGRDLPRPEWVALGRQLLRQGLLSQSQDGYATVDLTAAGLTALKDGRTFMLARPPAAARESAAPPPPRHPHGRGCGARRIRAQGRVRRHHIQASWPAML